LVYTGVRLIGHGDEFEWDAHNEDKLADKHNVDRYEAEDAATDPQAQALLRRVGTNRFGHPRYVGTGKTEGGRFLFFVLDKKGPGLWRIGSARDANAKERSIYKRRNG
jgi:uncharacterized DUF497 family protein